MSNPLFLSVTQTQPCLRCDLTMLEVGLSDAPLSCLGCLNNENANNANSAVHSEAVPESIKMTWKFSWKPLIVMTYDVMVSSMHSQLFMRQFSSKNSES